MADKRVVEPENLSASADAPEAEGAEQTATTEAKEQLAALTRERDDYYDRLLRKTAEFDNYRKRIDRERREQSDQAVLHEASPDHRDGEVIEELRRGYMIGDRLLRPAMVKVAKA